PLISGGSISKNYLYPGARVGWLSFHGEGLDKVKDAIQRLCNQRLSVNWEMQRGAIAALRGSLDHIHDFNSVMKKRRDLLVKRINDIEGLSVTPPKGAFYAFVKIDDLKGFKDDWAFVRALLREGVVVVPGSGFTSTHEPRYFRMVLLPKEEQINLAMDKLQNFMNK
ncbi:MAG: aminotransferase class I/II-fold pyridoxal phosphate-dependent enzyme, partial [Candidatus ainarchaeum sp.]|nr:aminotransferase class I/II-fold pyridoxal phosphate-dependent enzyme [Candidatus ainarchaeum sp.]